MSRRTRCLVLAVMLLLLVGCDQASKQYATEYWQHTALHPQSYFGDTFEIRYAENPGAFLSLFANLSKPVRTVLLTVMNGLILGGVAFVLLFRSGWDKVSFVALALLLAGGVGNLIDRIWLGGIVIDFMVIDLGGLTGISWLKTGIFNVADMAITTGFLLLLPQLLRKDPAPPATTMEAAA
jgi:signal peptidase II